MDLKIDQKAMGAPRGAALKLLQRHGRSRRTPLAVSLLAALIALSTVACGGPVRDDLPRGAPKTVRAEARLCDAGEAWGCHNVGLAWRDGSAGRVDISRSNALFQMACEQGAELACIELTDGVDLESADPVVAAASVVLEERCQAGIPQACEGLVRNLRAAGRVTEALDLAVRRCRLSPSYVCVAAAELYLELDDPVAGRPFLTSACAAGVVVACRVQADLDMEGVEGDPGRDVFALYTRACHSGDAEACIKIAELYTNGQGEREDSDYARLLYEEACELGSEIGCAGIEAQR